MATSTLFDVLSTESCIQGTWAGTSIGFRRAIDWQDRAIEIVRDRVRFRSPVFAEHAARALEERILAWNDRCVDALADIRTPIRQTLERMDLQLEADLRKLDRLLAGGITERPARRMPTLKRIAAFHNLCGVFCVRCGETDHLERAHIIDRWSGGLDHEANLAPLCYWCHHKTQPIFVPGDETDAYAWFGIPDPFANTR